MKSKKILNSGPLLHLIQQNYKIYDSYYSTVMNCGGVGYFSKLFHKQIEKPFQDYNAPRILELGSAQGEHFPYVKSKYNEYWQTDLRYPSCEEIVTDEALIVSSKDGRLIRAYLDACDLSRFPDNYFDRVIATCLVLHLDDLPKALSEWRRVLKPKGHISIYIHCEPGILLRLAQFFSTKRKFENLGIDYKIWQYSEHVTYYLRARTFLDKVFENDRIHKSRFPTKLLSWNFSLWEIYRVQKCE